MHEPQAAVVFGLTVLMAGGAPSVVTSCTSRDMKSGQALSVLCDLKMRSFLA